MDVKWVTLAQYSFSYEAEMTKSMLESQNIECMLLNQHMVDANWFYSDLVGGVKLQVRADQLERAQKVIQDFEAEARAGSTNAQGGGLECPRCKSDETQIVKPQYRGWILAGLYFLGLPLLFRVKEKWVCMHCHYSWKSKIQRSWLSYVVPIVVILGLMLVVKFILRVLGNFAS